jgi:hypothetical protein
MAQSLTEQFKAFVASKPADEGYDYMANSGCAMFQFLHAAGYPVAGVRGDGWRSHDYRVHLFPDSLSVALRGFPWTFGALLTRLEEAK